MTDKRRKRSYSSYKKKQILLPLMIAGDKRRDRGRMTGSSFGKKKKLHVLITLLYFGHELSILMVNDSCYSIMMTSLVYFRIL